MKHIIFLLLFIAVIAISSDEVTDSLKTILPTLSQADKINNDVSQVDEPSSGSVRDVHDNTTITSFQISTENHSNSSDTEYGTGNVSKEVSYSVSVPSGTSAIGELSILTEDQIGNRIVIEDDDGNVLFDNMSNDYKTGDGTTENYGAINLTPGSNLTITVTPEVTETRSDYWSVNLNISVSNPYTISAFGNTQPGFSGGYNPSNGNTTSAAQTYTPANNATTNPDPLPERATGNQWNTVQSTTTR